MPGKVLCCGGFYKVPKNEISPIIPVLHWSFTGYKSGLDFYPISSIIILNSKNHFLTHFRYSGVQVTLWTNTSECACPAPDRALSVLLGVHYCLKELI